MRKLILTIYLLSAFILTMATNLDTDYQERIGDEKQNIIIKSLKEIFFPDFLSTNKTISRLSSIASEISYIKLVTPKNVVVGNIRNLELYPNSLLLTDETLTIFHFSINGKLITNIKQIGRGPGEYTSIADIAFDKSTNLIAIACDDDRKIIFYDINGKFKHEVKLLERPEAIQFLENSQILIKLNTYVKNTGLIQSSIIIDKSGKVLKAHMYTVKEMPESYVPLRYYGSIITSSDGLIIYEPFNDTIYKVYENGLRKPFILNNLGKYKAPRKYYESTGFGQKYGSQYFTLPMTFYLSDFALTTFRFKQITYNGLYDFKNDRAILFEKGNNQYRLSDDLDFGPPFTNAKTVNKNLIIDLLEPIKLANDKSIKPRKGSDLEKITSLITENDNPIIRIIKIKK